MFGAPEEALTKSSASPMLILFAVPCSQVLVSPMCSLHWLVVCAHRPLYAIFALISRLLLGDVVPGWTSVIVLLAIVGGIQMILTGVIGLYVGKIYEETKQRPLYVIRQALGMDSAAAPALGAGVRG